MLCSPNQGLCSLPSYARGVETMTIADTSQGHDATAVGERRLWHLTAWFRPGCAVAGCVTFHKLLGLSVPQFAYQ